MVQHISTKSGDTGTSGLFDGKRYPKSDPVFTLLGAIDELSAHIGVALQQIPDNFARDLRRIQQNLLVMGSHLASLNANNPIEFPASGLENIERHMAIIESKLPELKNFILPGGPHGAAQLHLARSVCRRAEREYWKFSESTQIKPRATAGQYLNRLSDYLFQLARLVSL